mmetsp:Transcript_51357/g.135396  ORF Transcript_51357/g.135396 Transcript_51357/m.135396 type:complete len:222 (-) Transcript_51357:1557-2222(-)
MQIQDRPFPQRRAPKLERQQIRQQAANLLLQQVKPAFSQSKIARIREVLLDGPLLREHAHLELTHVRRVQQGGPTPHPSRPVSGLPQGRAVQLLAGRDVVHGGVQGGAEVPDQVVEIRHRGNSAVDDQRQGTIPHAIHPRPQCVLDLEDQKLGHTVESKSKRCSRHVGGQAKSATQYRKKIHRGGGHLHYPQRGGHLGTHRGHQLPGQHVLNNRQHVAARP